MKKLVSFLLVLVMVLSFSTVFADTQQDPVDMNKLGNYSKTAVICERYPIFD